MKSQDCFMTCCSRDVVDRNATTSTESGLIGSPSLCITRENSAMRNATTEWTSLVLTTREISYKASPKIRAAEVFNDWMTE